MTSIKGGHSIVQLRDETAVKIIDNCTQGHWLRELFMLKKLSHPHILKCNDFWFDRRSVHLESKKYVGDLSDVTWPLAYRVQNLDELFIPLFDAVNYIKQNGIVHMDIKLSNIFVDNKKLILADFSSAQFIGASYDMATKKYEPPEPPLITYSTDVYMLANAILHFLLDDFEPKWVNGEFFLKDFDKVIDKFPSKVIKLLPQMMHRESTKRPKIEELCRELELPLHPRPISRQILVPDVLSFLKEYILTEIDVVQLNFINFKVSQLMQYTNDIFLCLFIVQAIYGIKGYDIQNILYIYGLKFMTIYENAVKLIQMDDVMALMGPRRIEVI